MPQEIKVLEGAEEFAFGDGPVGALLLHGFTSSPQNMRPLGEYLAERGITVVCPRFPGHGTSWEDLSTRRSEEWVETAETAFHHLASQRDEVFLVGLSFGGAVALDLAARYPDRVDGVVGLAPFLFSKDPRRFLSPVIRRVVRAIPGVGNDIADPEMREIVYDKVPTGAAHHMLEYVKRAKLGLPAVRCPVLVIHSPHDHTAHPSNAQVIYDTVGSEDKNLIWLERSYHVITLDVEREQVFENTFSFIKDRSKAGAQLGV